MFLQNNFRLYSVAPSRGVQILPAYRKQSFLKVRIMFSQNNFRVYSAAPLRRCVQITNQHIASNRL
jgi:hypothetical protein